MYVSVTCISIYTVYIYGYIYIYIIHTTNFLSLIFSAFSGENSFWTQNRCFLLLSVFLILQNLGFSGNSDSFPSQHPGAIWA